ncbi:LpqN/LpqT family lipoprotein [Mycolicibacterium sp. S2-37]|uniref:LpqN/LpqT family lipoprotein n=1 Tax=Mycolicibacterium sp. S2-37 TaxID=2810297 RepID=UPI001A944280|nr:LpqN/LpqT family lipoprotein [Mycolicibacterium sp. S2-37]MBO0680072.1 LpqN/LpqT family lipoprotein [Mycolicibacterium sp. S2-37]
MSGNARHRRVLTGSAALGVAGAIGFACAASAWAQPLYPQPPVPRPGTVAVAPTATPVTRGVPLAPGSVTTQSATTTPAAAAAPVPTLLPATSGTLAEFFASKGVAMQPQAPREFKALNITLPMPPGWAYIPDPNVPDAYAVIADRVGGDGLYSSNAQIKVYKLVGDFDPDQAISHGFIDSQMLPSWRSTAASLAPFHGMPSSLIEGTFRENSMSLNTSRRHVIATSGPDRYLVSLAVTTTVDQAIPAADATDAIVNGFRVTSPTAPPPAALPPGPPAPQPGLPPMPQPAPLPTPLGMP